MVHFYYRVIIFLIGVLLGVLLAIQYKSYVEPNTSLKVPYMKSIPSYNSWFEESKLKRREVEWDTLRYRKHDYLTESQFLFNKIKILCIILVRNLKNAIAIEDTWGKGCNSIKFIELNVKNTKVMSVKRSKESSSWVLLCKYLKIINYDAHDWVLIVSDTTFVILENLRYYVAALNSSDKYYLGHTISFWNTIYNSGEAGYTLSKGSLQALNKKLEEVGCSTNVYWNREDFYLGKLLSSLNIKPIDTRDSNGLSTFHPYNWYHVFFPGESYYKTSVFPVKCCSKKSISFQAIEGDKMYTYNYLLYTLQIFSYGTLGNAPPPVLISDEQVWKEFLKERNIPSDNITSMQYYKVWEDLVNDPYSFAAHMKKEVQFDYD